MAEPTTYPMQRHRASDVAAMLDRHYYLDEKPWAGVGIQEIQSPCQTRRADYLYVPCTTGGGMGDLIGHEIKVTRADVLNDISDPTKADAWAKYCTAWYLVVSDAAFVEGLDVPPAWGILAPPPKANGRRMRVIRPAPRTQSQSHELALKHIVKHMNNHMGERLRKSERMEQHYKEQLAKAHQQVKELRIENASFDPHDRSILGRRKQLIELLVLLDQATAHDWQWQDDNETIVQAIVDSGQVARISKQVATEIERTIRDLESEFDPLRRSRDQLLKVLEQHKVAS